MEPIVACFNEDWESSLSGIFSNVEADHFMAHLYGANNEYGNIFGNNGVANSSNFLSIDETNMNINEIESANLYNFSNSFHTNYHHFSEENSNTSSSNSPFFPTQTYENNHFFGESNPMLMSNNNVHEFTSISSDGFSVPNFPHHVMEEILLMKAEVINGESENGFNQASNVADFGEELKLKRKINMQERETRGDEQKNEATESPKKKPRLPNAQKGKRNALSKKNKKISLNSNDEENNGLTDVKNHLSTCSSEDDTSNIASQDSKLEADAALNTSGKTRASRGAATDPQSLYARRRRERINERLRILQNLVPNGTKVDISTMLEEAVQYVKFLQLQIKLLSSDDLWMFAPIAYNGMDMGLYEKLSI